MVSKNTINLLICLKELKGLMDLCDEEKEREKRRFWVNPFLSKREDHNLEAHLLKDLLWSSIDYKNFCRMNINDFEEILRLLDPKIRKKDTQMRAAITSRVRLAITLRYIATGDSYRSLEFLSYISRKTISTFVPEVLTAIVEELQNEYLKIPSNEREWNQIVDEFNNLWQFPHTLGAIDGKHIRIKAPPHSGSDFYNFKGFFSIVLFAVVDAHSRFIYIDVGGNGRASDVVLLKNSSLYKAIKSGTLNIPPDKALEGQVLNTSYFFIGDDIFGLDRHIMKAYNRNSNLTVSQEAFNYRLSRARMTVEMAFGRLVTRFRIFHRPIEVQLETTDLIVKACCVLHNYLSKNLTEPLRFNQEYTINFPETITPLPTQSIDAYKFAFENREKVRKYVVTDGDVPFQWIKIQKQVANPVSISFE